MTVSVKNVFAQGDLFAIRVDALPDGLTKVNPVSRPYGNNVHVVAHSETGHDHFLNAAGVHHYQDPQNPLVCYLMLESPAVLEHNRSFDTHTSIKMPAGIFKIHRQREKTPEGWRQVAD